MGRVVVIGGLAALAFAVFAIVDCALTERQRVNALPRSLWIVLIAILPVVGGLLWFLLGRSRGATAPVRRVIGPDDDPEFLRGVRIRRDPPAAEPDWRLYEQELAASESDADDDTEGSRS